MSGGQRQLDHTQVQNDSSISGHIIFTDLRLIIITKIISVKVPDFTV